MDSQNNVLSKEIQKKVKNSELIALQRHKIDSYILLDLDKVLDDVYCSVQPVSTEYDTRNELVKNLNAMAIDIYGDSEESSLVLEAYGSFVMDTFSTKSDLDVSINFGNNTSELTRGKKIQTLRRFAEKLHSLEGQGHVKNVKAILRARVPIVRFCDQGTAIECDLAVESKDGILNSKIIRIISQIDDRFHKLCMLIKHWAKAHGVINASHKTLNSISITLLVAHHLQTQNPPILPPFSMLFKDGIDPPKVEKRTQKFFLNWGQCNQESLGKLFATFFIKKPFGAKGYAPVLNGLWISKTWKRAVISVEDFTDVSKNVAKSVGASGAIKIYSSINRTVDDILEFLNGKVDGEYLKDKLFGQQATVVEPSSSPHVMPLNVYSQQPRNKYRNEFTGRAEEPRNKRVRLENGYKAAGGKGRGNGHLVNHRHGGRFSGEEPMPVGLWHDYSRSLDLPPPPPPYDRVLYKKFGLY